MMINRERLINEFLELVRIDSPSSEEGAVARVLVAKLEQLGLAVYIDDAGMKTGGETGNIIAKLSGNRPGKSVLFSCHMDTVGPGIGITPIVDEVNSIIKSDGTTILGADDKAGIAAVLEAIRTIKENAIPHGDIQIVFTIWEEGGLFGAKELDFSKINSDFTFVLDSSGSPGRIVVQSPSQDKIKVKITGRAAHAGFSPEEGISAVMVAARAIDNMKLLRIDEETTANIGIINGGLATNIVMPYLEITAEARSLNNSKLEAQTKHMVDTFTEAAIHFGAEIDIETLRQYSAFCIAENEEIVNMAKKAFLKLGIEPKVVASGGGSDANVFNANGIKSINLSMGMQKPHTLEEYILIEDLVTCARMIVGIINEA